jgi:hypothetical protein
LLYCAAVPILAPTAAIVSPVFRALVFILDVVFHVPPAFPDVVLMPLVVMLTVCLVRDRQERGNADCPERDDPGA